MTFDDAREQFDGEISAETEQNERPIGGIEAERIEKPVGDIVSERNEGAVGDIDAERTSSATVLPNDETFAAISSQVDLGRTDGAGESVGLQEEDQNGGDIGVSGEKTRTKSGVASIQATLARFKSPRFSAAYIAKLAILTAMSFLLYYLGRFVKLPFMFPSFLDMQISELPALLAGFSLGPVSGCLVIIFKCLLKFPLSSTAYVGEATDMILGVALVLPASLIYRLRRDKTSSKSGILHALIGMVVGSVLLSAAAIVVNRYISVPFYVEMFFGGNFDAILGVVRPLYKNVTQDNFYAYYLLLGVLPFNLLRCIIVSALTFLLYKRLSAILHWEGTSLKTQKTELLLGRHVSKGVNDTDKLARRLADELDGGEIILLDGDLGAGKTTFTKGLAAALGVKEEITSPTFSILNVYDSGRVKLYHMDMYRIENEDDIAELGLDTCFDDEGVTVIEWNKFENLQGKIYRIKISAGEGENERIFDVSLDGEE